jgi:hypothetical protein
LSLPVRALTTFLLTRAGVFRARNSTGNLEDLSFGWRR